MGARERQYALYGYLEGVGNQWVPQKEIANALQWYYPLFDDDKFHDSNSRNIMTKDIRAINNSDEFEKVIISGSRGIKLATEEEFRSHIKHQYISVFNKIKRIRKKEQKGLMNGQVRLVFQSEKDIVEAFLQDQ